MNAKDIEFIMKKMDAIERRRVKDKEDKNDYTNLSGAELGEALREVEDAKWREAHPKKEDKEDGEVSKD
jgi:hypothetical protein